MRKILLVVATVMCMGGAFAQLSMGPKLGLNVSSLTGDGSNFRAGMNVGIFANYRINKLLVIYRFSRKLWNRTILHTI